MGLADSQERLTAVLLGSLDDQRTDTRGLAARSYQSRSQLYRLYQAWAQEPPATMRRRLLLERSAWQLSRTRTAVTAAALDAGYGSLEAFTRAFRKAFGVSPSLYRRMGATHYRLPAPNGIHFAAPTKGAIHTMDLFDRFTGTDSWHTRRLLERAQQLTEEQMDQAVPGGFALSDWCEPDRSLRQILERLVQTKEIWTAALTGGAMPNTEPGPPETRTAGALLVRFEQADAAFRRVLEDVRARGAWDDTFIDALCEPAETFTFGGVFAHVITFNTYRRFNAQGVLRQLGVELEGTGCPIEYEAAVAPWREVEASTPE